MGAEARAGHCAKSLGLFSECGWGTWIRTKTNRVRVCCATVTPFPNGIAEQIQIVGELSSGGRTRARRKSRLIVWRLSTRSFSGWQAPLWKRFLVSGSGAAVRSGQAARRLATRCAIRAIPPARPKSYAADGAKRDPGYGARGDSPGFRWRSIRGRAAALRFVK